MVKQLDYKPIQQRIKALRIAYQLSEETVANYLETSDWMYRRYELGLTNIGLTQIVALCKFYGVSTDYILGYENTGEILAESMPKRDKRGVKS